MNTQYFHAQLKNRRAQTTISSICNGQGERLMEEKQIKEEILSYYKGLIGSSSIVETIDNTIFSSGPMVTQEQCADRKSVV